MGLYHLGPIYTKNGVIIENVLNTKEFKHYLLNPYTVLGKRRSSRARRVFQTILTVQEGAS